MYENQLLPDDPRLTAYALGELDPSEREAIERLMGDSPPAQLAVREIRELAGLLATELRQEPVAALTAAQRSAILDAGAPTVAPATATLGAARRRFVNSRWVSRFAALATVAALFAVAALLPAPGNRSDDVLPSAYYLKDDLGNRPSG